MKRTLNDLSFALAMSSSFESVTTSLHETITSPVSGSMMSFAATRPTTSVRSMLIRSTFASRSFFTATLVNLVPFFTRMSLPTLMSAELRCPARMLNSRDFDSLSAASTKTVSQS